MERRDCDAVVLFGASGDLCYRKIYPALYQLVRRGLPVGSFGNLGGVGSQHGGCRFDCLLVGSALLSLSVLRISDQTQNQRRWRKYGCNANWPFQESERDRLACI